MLLRRTSLYLILGIFLFSCAGDSASNTMNQALKSALTLAANFDQGTDANFAAGDAKLYTAYSYDSLANPQAGIHSDAYTIAEGKGKSGNALQFKEKTTPVIFYESEKNISYSKEDWNATVSLWLSLNPEEDLAPGYTDPIQITDAGYDDAAIWVDFSNKNPRSFRMGVYGDVNVWNPDKIGPDENPAFNSRLLPAKDRPFSGDSWTHVCVSIAGLNTANGKADFYMNGIHQGSREISETFTWDYAKSKIFLGLNFVGLMDEVSIYNKALSEAEVKALYQLPRGLKDILK